MTCTFQHTWTDTGQAFQEYLMILVSAISAAQLLETITKQCSALADSQASLLQHTKLSIQNQSTQALRSQSLWSLTVFNMGLSLLCDFMSA